MANTILYKLSLDATQFQAGIKKAERSLKKAEQSFNRIGKNLTKYVTVPTLAIGTIGAKAWDKQAKAMAQVEQGLKSTGNAAGFTKEQLFKMANALGSKTIFGDEKILKDVTAQLLTFTNVAGEQFKRTQQVAMDLATRLDGDLKSATIMVAKAMNDPIANLSAMSRAGIQFSESQKELIKNLWKTGDAAGSQKIILTELEKQYGGSAQAAVVGMGKIQQTMNLLSDVMEDVGRIFLEMIDPVLDKIKLAVERFKGMEESQKRMIVVVGSLAGAIGPLLLIIGKLIGLLRVVMVTMAGITSPITLVVAGLAALSSGIVYLWQNWAAVKERISDWAWWKNMLVDMLQFLIEYSPISAMIKSLNALLSYFGKAEIPNPFEALADKLEQFKSETKEYEHEFGNFWDAIKNGAEDVANAMGFSFKKAKAGLDAFLSGSSGGGSQLVGGGSKSVNKISSVNPNEVVGSSSFSTEGLADMSTFLEMNTQKLNLFRSALGQTLSMTEQLNLMSSSFQQLGDAIGGSFGVIMGKMSAVARLIPTLISQITALTATEVAGSQAVTAAKASEAVASGTAASQKVPFPLNLVALAATIASVVSALATKPKVPALAGGGLATAPTLAIVGDNKNAHVDPEVIMPASKLKDAMGGMFGGGFGGETEVIKITNEAIYLGFKKFEKQQEGM